jgi:hypothetical protein
MIQFILLLLFLSPAVVLTEPRLQSTLVFPPYFHSYGIRKATPAKLFMFFGPKVRFNDPQGLAAVFLESWDDPKTDKDDDQLTVYGVNSGTGTVIYNTSMYALDYFGYKDQGPYVFKNPRGIAADPQGRVYVCDTDHHCVVKLFNPGKKLGFIGVLGGPGKDKNRFSYPHQVGYDLRHNLFVTDSGNNRVAVIDSNGNFLREVRILNGQSLEGPTGIAVMDSGLFWNFRNQRHLYVVDRQGTRLWHSDLKGGFIRMVEPGKSLGRPVRIGLVLLGFIAFFP